jgi:hypothetical protein
MILGFDRDVFEEAIRSVSSEKREMVCLVLWSCVHMEIMWCWYLTLGVSLQVDRAWFHRCRVTILRGRFDNAA